jgi:NAD(P)H dehydrogenase (quinone)
MKHAIIVGHPDPDSFTLTLAKAYADAVQCFGHEHVTRDLYQLDFDPRLKLSEIPGRDGWGPAPDIAAERALLKDADVFAFIYPLWFNAPPAMVKGYIDRVFGAGFGYALAPDGGRTPLLLNRQLIHVSASGSSSAWLNEQGAWVSMRNLFEDYFGKVCGMDVLRHIHFESIVPGLAPRWVKENLKTFEIKLQESFAPNYTSYVPPPQ